MGTDFQNHQNFFWRMEGTRFLILFMCGTRIETIPIWNHNRRFCWKSRTDQHRLLVDTIYMGTKIHTRIWAGDTRLPLKLWNLFFFLLKQSAAYSPSKRKKQSTTYKTGAMPCQFPGIDLSTSLLQCAQAKNGTYVSPDQNKQGRGTSFSFQKVKKLTLVFIKLMMVNGMWRMQKIY